MRIAIASDHGGYNLKEKLYNYLKEKYEIKNFGTDSTESCDYPYYANLVANAVKNKEFDRGILVCGTGIGMAIAANRIAGIRAVNASDTYSAKMSRKHNDANILTLGERVIGQGEALDIVDAWLETEYEGGRHQKRIDMLD